jgi:hypothetical protein
VLGDAEERVSVAELGVEALLALFAFGSAFILGALLGKSWSRDAILIALALALLAGAIALLTPAKSISGIAGAIVAIGAALFALGASGHALFTDRVRAILSTLAIGALGMWPIMAFGVFAACIHTERCF